MVQLFNENDDKLMPYIRKIANKVLEYYPGHIPSISNLGISYLVTKEYDKALSYFKKAEKINPGDAIVLNNIAYTYELTGDIDKAIVYYRKIVKYGNDEERKFAERAIEELEKQQSEK
jgi:tetratricopeptide (TPR) repeat protein